MPFTRKPVEGDLRNSEQRFRRSLRYLIKVADSNICEFCNTLGVSRKAVIYYEEHKPDFVKFLGFTVGLYRIASDKGRLYELNAAYRQAVGYNIQELMHIEK